MGRKACRGLPRLWCRADVLQPRRSQRQLAGDPQGAMRPAMRSAFTLIELLVVVTIIVVLLALLTPALDKAIRSAELAMCAAQLHAVGNGAIMYAHGNKRRY